MLPWPHLSEWMLTRLSCWCLGSGIAVEQNASFYGLPLFETYFSLFLKVAKPDCWIWATFVWMEHLAVQAPGTSLCDWLEDWTIWKIEHTHFFFIPPPHHFFCYFGELIPFNLLSLPIWSCFKFLKMWRFGYIYCWGFVCFDFCLCF